MDISRSDDLKEDATALLKKIEFANELMRDLKASEDTIIEAQAKIPSLKETQWRMKHKMKNLMSYHEFLTQLTKPPEDWLTSEQVTAKTKEIIEEYNKEKTAHKSLLEKSQVISETLQEAEVISQSGEDIRFEVEEIKRKIEKLNELKAKFDSKPRVFEGLCETKVECDSLMKDLRKEIEQEKETIDLLQKTSEIDAEADECAEDLLLQSVENFFEIHQDGCKELDDKCIIESLTAQLMGKSK